MSEQAAPSPTVRVAYSTQAHYAVGVLGGPLAALLLSGASAQRLGALQRWRPTLLLFAATVAALTLTAGYLVASDPSLAAALPSPPRRGLGTLNRVAGIAVFGVVHLLRGKELERSHAQGEPPSAWGVGAACVLAGQLASALLYGAGELLAR